MPEIPDVVVGETIVVAWGNPIRDRTVQRYTDAAQRDALNPTPTPGDLAYLTSTGEFSIWDGGAWYIYATQAWVLGSFVELAGDTMSGDLNIENPVGTKNVITIKDPGSTEGIAISREANGSWRITDYSLGSPVIYKEAGDEDVIIRGITIVDGEAITMQGAGSSNLLYTDAFDGVNIDKDAIWGSTGIPGAYRLFTIASLAADDPVVASFAAEFPSMIRAEDPAEPTHRDLIQMLIHEVEALKARLDTLEAAS
jgi:hypothetical protein